MKNIGLIVLVSIISSITSIVIYDYFKEDPPEIVTIQERAPVKYTNYPSSETLETANKNSYPTTAPTDFIKAADAVRPAVVNIKSTQGSKRSSTFDDFWGQSQRGVSSGSGVILSPDGYIVTNHHVIENASKIEVTLNSNRTLVAKVIGTDPSTDLALIKVKDQTNMPYLEFGDSDLSQVGEWVLAVGNPFNLTSTVTAGIISSKGRNINILEGAYKIESFIQTDAAVNPGNSGGALVNTNGELIGINTAIITQSGRYEGYSFAVPANLVKKVVKDIRDFGMVKRGFLGVTIEDVTEDIAKRMGLKAIEGVHISQVNINSAAEDAGLKKGDVLTHINGAKVNSMPSLQEQVARYRPGDKISASFIRKGKKKNIQIVLKDKRNRTTITSKHNVKLLEQLGFQLRELNRAEKQTLKVKSGVKVISVPQRQ